MNDALNKIQYTLQHITWSIKQILKNILENTLNIPMQTLNPNCGLTVVPKIID